jgi:hypothetical protein
VYCDIGYAACGNDASFIRAECVNNTDAPQQLVLHCMASLHFPPVLPYKGKPIRLMRVTLPAGGGTGLGAGWHLRV